MLSLHILDVFLVKLVLSRELEFLAVGVGLFSFFFVLVAMIHHLFHWLNSSFKSILTPTGKGRLIVTVSVGPVVCGRAGDRLLRLLIDVYLVPLLSVVLLLWFRLLLHVYAVVF